MPWELLVSFLAGFRALKLPLIGVYVFELTNTLMGAQLLRQQINYRIHWLRAFVLTLVAGVGGNSAASFFTGRTPRWINGKIPSSKLAISRATAIARCRPRVVFCRRAGLLDRLSLPRGCS